MSMTPIMAARAAPVSRFSDVVPRLADRGPDLLWLADGGWISDQRARRRLVKLVSVVDLSHAQLGQYDAGFFTALSQSGKLSEIYYPQQLLRNVGVNAPGMIGLE